MIILTICVAGYFQGSGDVCEQGDDDSIVKRGNSCLYWSAPSDHLTSCLPEVADDCRRIVRRLLPTPTVQALLVGDLLCQWISSGSKSNIEGGPSQIGGKRLTAWQLMRPVPPQGEALEA